MRNKLLEEIEQKGYNLKCYRMSGADTYYLLKEDKILSSFAIDLGKMVILNYEEEVVDILNQINQEINNCGTLIDYDFTTEIIDRSVEA